MPPPPSSQIEGGLWGVVARPDTRYRVEKFIIKYSQQSSHRHCLDCLDNV